MAKAQTTLELRPATIADGQQIADLETARPGMGARPHRTSHAPPRGCRGGPRANAKTGRAYPDAGPGYRPGSTDQALRDVDQWREGHPDHGADAHDVL